MKLLSRNAPKSKFSFQVLVFTYLQYSAVLLYTGLHQEFCKYTTVQRTLAGEVYIIKITIVRRFLFQ